MLKKNALISPATQNELSDLASVAALQAQFLTAATSDNTRRAYRSAVRHFLNWGASLPADEASLTRYLIAHAQTLNPRTLSLKLTALSQWHKQQGFLDPCAAPQVRKILTGIMRIHGKPKKKARALMIEDLEVIVTMLTLSEQLTDQRDNALLQIGFFGGLRRSELVALQFEDIKWEREGITITLARSKTDQLGVGIQKAIPSSDGLCCPARALQVWSGAAGIVSGPVFRRIDQWGRVGQTGLHAASINAILTTAASRAGLAEVGSLSSHSLRRGMATSAHRAGANFRDIKRQGGWRFDGTVHGYIEEADQFKENALTKLLGRKQ